MVDVHDLRGSLGPYKAAVAALVQHYGSASASLSRDHYAAMRAKAGITAPFRIPTVNPAPTEQVDASIGWATRDLWDSRLLKAPEEFDPTPILDAAQTKVGGAASKLALDAGRAETISATESDRTALAWARVARPDACWWCAMLATRGAVYTSAASAGRIKASDALRVAGMPARDAKGFVNRYHDHCHCTVEPVFTAYEPPAHIREWQALWEKTMSPNGPTGPDAVTGMDAMQAAWRDAYNAQLSDLPA